ncbi:hypothetical protein A0H81_07011 [Grifola frondosa]|uniref:Uncharacterized protein n=1 Tax=Grifola frondosa TaxID=5627 RepID=A0A1C7ME38_GRIFR|nr:hypothetical protein A0H81_07011 [Grifola frondosa]
MRPSPTRSAGSLTCEIARLLRGERGGIVGLRFSVEERGRAIHGEGLQMPVPVEKRIIKVGVGEWYPWAKEVQERFREDGKEHEYDNALEAFGVDEFGKRMDGVEWRQERPLTNSRSIEADALATIPQEDREAMSDFEKKQVVYKYMMDHMGELANMGSDRHSAVVYPNISSQYSD